MKLITLAWRQARAVKRQIEAAEDGKVLGHWGKVTMDDKATVEWSPGGIVIEVPDAVLGSKREE